MAIFWDENITADIANKQTDEYRNELGRLKEVETKREKYKKKVTNDCLKWPMSSNGTENGYKLKMLVY